MPTTIARDSADDRKGPANRSPFRSQNPSKRYIAGLEMIAKREQELEDLSALLAVTKDQKTKRILSQRIRATAANLESWNTYMSEGNEREETAYREPRAVVHPPKPDNKAIRLPRRAA